MSTTLTISDVGLRLIKAYEGFRPVDIELISGQRVAGYGHRVMNGESLHLSKKKAEKLLRRDLAPYEAMINDSVFAPLTQSQFDALCSLAFNIGPKKFLESDVVRALNNGRVLDAANAFDVWRKGQINGESYVVDALVRRRTAEKVLFLRPNLNAVRAPRAELKAAADIGLKGLTTAAPEPVLEDSGFVPSLNFENESAAALNAAVDETEIKDDIDAAQSEPRADMIDILKDMFMERRNPENQIPASATPMRRREDRPGGMLTLSEVYDGDHIEGDDDAFEPLIEDLDGFDLDIETTQTASSLTEEPLLLDNVESSEAMDDIVEVDDTVLPLTPLQGGTNESLEEDLIANDPSEYIVGERKNQELNEEEVLVLNAADETPSPIAAAAAEVSGRLDALMAQQDANAPEGSKKVLPFRSKKTAPNSPVEAKALREENPVYGNLLVSDEADNLSSETDELISETDMSSQKDSASRYIANNIAPVKSRPATTGLNLLVILGMVLLAVSVATMLSGADQRFGPSGEFLSTVGALLGLMITLGSIYYILRNMNKARQS